MHSLRIHHAKQVVLVCNNEERLLMGKAMKNLAILEGGLERGVSIVVNNAGKIECVDFDDKVDQDYPNCTYEEEVDASGMCVVPGKTNSFHTVCNAPVKVNPDLLQPGTCEALVGFIIILAAL